MEEQSNMTGSTFNMQSEHAPNLPYLQLQAGSQSLSQGAEEETPIKVFDGAKKKACLGQLDNSTVTNLLMAKEGNGACLSLCDPHPMHCLEDCIGAILLFSTVYFK